MNSPTNKQTRTTRQNSALHLWLEQVAQVLKEDGQSMQTILSHTKFEIMPTQESVKVMIFKPIMDAMFGKKSTTQLSKQQEIDQVVDVIIKHFGDRGISIPNFPSIEEQSLLNEYK